jgi:phosphoadenosine phosphosulfate reductase
MAVAEAVAVATNSRSDVPADSSLLNARFGELDAYDAIAVAVEDLFRDRIALVSSFGADSVVLLHLLSEVDRHVPVIFLDTGRLFPETLEYRTAITGLLGLTDVRTVSPDPQALIARDPHRALWMTNSDQCCQLRKAEPLDHSLAGFDAWFTGRKRYQNGVRAALDLFETDAGRIKINPLARWSPVDVKTYIARHDLPEHPLVSKGYPSIGCGPCTSRVQPGEDHRAGRWRDNEKTECGIHTEHEIDGSGI